jgi:universal stress protein E
MLTTPAFERAAQLAEGLDGTLRIVAFVPQDQGIASAAQSDAPGNQRSPMWAFQRWLNAEAGVLGKGGLHVCAEVLWCPSTVANICSYIKEAEVDYVIKDMQEDQSAQGPTLSALDWQLLHESPVPVLLVKRHGDKPSRRIIAAVDILHCEPEVREMNRCLIEAGYLLVRSFGASLHLLSVYDRDALPVAQGDEHRPASMLSYHQARQRFDALADQYAIALQNRHFIVSEAAGNIGHYVGRNGFDVLVLGTKDYLSTDLLLGRTERCVLGDPPCSVLAYKSRRLLDRSMTHDADNFAAIHAL